MKKLLFYLIMSSFCLLLGSCGSTRVSVERPSQGTQTTITVTTNNPITTNVNPTTKAEVQLKKKGTNL